MQQVLQAENAENDRIAGARSLFFSFSSKLLIRSINFAPSGLLQQVL
jgi:hypothetical protein